MVWMRTRKLALASVRVTASSAAGELPACARFEQVRRRLDVLASVIHQQVAQMLDVLVSPKVGRHHDGHAALASRQHLCVASSTLTLFRQPSALHFGFRLRGPTLQD